MIKTLGRSSDGKHAMVVEVTEEGTFIRAYKQKNGMSDFKDVLSSLQLDARTLELINATCKTHGFGKTT
jgi:hypothetical protein